MDKNQSPGKNGGVRRPWHGWPAWLSMRDSPGQTLKMASGGSLAHGLTQVAVFLGVIVALVGAGHLAAWLGGYMTQRGLSTITMKTNAALCLTLVGAALMLLVPTEAGRARRWAARGCATLALLVGLLTLVENLSGGGFGIDQLLAAETPGAMATTSPNRMGIPASLSFTLIGSTLLILSRRDHRGVRVAQALALAVCLIALLPTVGFLYGAQEFYGIARYTAIAWPTAVVLLLVGAGLLCARPAEGLMAQVTADDPGGISLRRLLPAFVILPLLLGWLRLAAERAGVFDAATGTGMMMLLFIIIFSALTYHASRGASHSTHVLRESEERFRALVTASSEVLYRMSPDWSEMCQLHGRGFLANTERPSRTWLQEYIPPDDQAHVIAAVQEAIRTKGVFELEHRVRRADGSVGWTFSRAVPLLDANGEIVEWFGSANDITERKQAEGEKKKLVHDLRERIKELTATYRTMEIVQQPKPVPELLQEVVSLLPGAWQYPEITAARISFDGQEYRTPGYAGSVWAQSARFSTSDARDGGIEVVYLEERPAEAEGPFLAEERSLIDSLARILVGFLNRRISEKALRESERKTAEILESISDGFLAIDSQWRITYTNHRAAGNAGLEPADAIGRNLWEAVPSLRGSIVEEKYRQAMAQRQPLHFEFCGKIRPIWYSVSVYPSSDGITVYWQDITERKQAEAALRESEERFRTAFAEGAVAMALTALDSTLLKVNSSFCRMLGFSESELVGRSFTEITHPDDRAANLVGTRRLARGEISSFRMEKRYLRKDGAVVWGDMNTASVRDDQGRPLYCVTHVQDITERKRAEETLRDLNATLESKVTQRTAQLQRRAAQLQKLTLELSQAEDRERRRIALILHEDLQQQIAGARFHVNLLKGRARDDRQRADADRVDEMLKEAIEKSRSLSHDLSPAVLHMNDLAEVLQWLVNRVRAQHGLIAHVDVSGEMTLQSEALAMFLFRAAQEMLSNVVKHARVKEARLRVRRIGRYVCLSVSDRGRGFDPQELKETSGFGLLNIRERTELLGGRMKIESATGQGSRFRIVVPDGPAAEDRRRMTEDGRQKGENGVPSSVLRPPASDGALRVLRVLLVDDHEIVRQGLVSLLQEMPDVVVVGEAADGREAINLTGELHPDVVIMDVSMPLISGEAATRQIKTYLPETRVIALSMYDEADKRERMFQAGAEGYLLKTASSDELLAAIRGAPPRPQGMSGE